MRKGETLLGSKSEVKVVDCGVDWITVTCAKKVPDHESILDSWWNVLKRRRTEIGQTEPATFLGYQGLKCDGIFVGTRWDGAMIRISGSFARHAWQGVRVGDGTVTRLDVQVTVEWIGDGPHPPRMAAIQAEAANELMPSSRKRRIEEYHDNQEGYTTYIGSRQSASFCRVYNKSAQAPDDYGPNCYRYEVQFNKDSAGAIHKALLSHLDNIDHAAIACVWDWFELRGVIPVFRRSSAVVIVSRETIPLTDLDRKLQWLYNQVRPTVTTLLETTSREAVLVALLGTSLGKEVESSLMAFELAELVPGLTEPEREAAARKLETLFDQGPEPE